MKNLFIIVMCMFAVVQLHAEAGWGCFGNVHFRKVKPNIETGKGIHRAPYYGDAVTWSYSEPAALLTLWFHYAAENTEIVIIKDGETIADKTFDMSADEVLECDFSECEVGEYEVYVSAYGEAYVLGRFCVN